MGAVTESLVVSEIISENQGNLQGMIKIIKKDANYSLGIYENHNIYIL